MASDTVPAAVPGPNEPPERAGHNPTGTTPAGTEPGALTSLFAAVDPARPAFDLTPSSGAAAGADEGPEQPVDGASSAAYHDGENTEKDSKNGNSRKEKSVIRAWLLAGAARWAKGGGTQNKRLDVAKARAMADKETRQVKENRTSGGLLPGGGNSSGAGSKNLGSKGASSGAGKGPKNSSGNASSGSAGRSRQGAGTGSAGSSGSGGRGPAGGGGSAGGKSGGGTSAKGSNGRSSGGGDSPKTPKSKAEGPKGNATPRSSGTSGSTGGSGKNGAKGSDGGSGKTTSRNNTTGSGRDRQSTATCGDGSGISMTKDKKDRRKDSGAADSRDKNQQKNGPSPSSTTGKDDASKNGSSKTSKQPDSPSPKGSTDRAGKGGDSGKTTTPGVGGNAPGVKDKGKTSDTNQPDKTKKTDQPGKDHKPNPASQDGQPFSTRESRETGYRDGTRAAKVVAHVQAYRDGVKDGYTDTSAAADRDKARLDQAHAEHKTARKEQPVTDTASSADHHGPKPVQVTSVTATHVGLGDGAARASMTRGEVRSLKAYERRLRGKRDVMTRVADAAKGLRAHADAQAKKATQLSEQAKAVKGGEKLAAKLTKLQDAAQTQAMKAEEIHKRAARAAEGCGAVLANAETRYGGIYKAVVNSDETAPAELRFYKES